MRAYAFARWLDRVVAFIAHTGQCHNGSYLDWTRKIGPLTFTVAYDDSETEGFVELKLCGQILFAFYYTDYWEDYAFFPKMAHACAVCSNIDTEASCDGCRYQEA